MHRDKKVGLALAILLCSIVGAFFFRDDAPRTNGPELRDAQRLDQTIARDNPRGPYSETDARTRGNGPRQSATGSRNSFDPSDLPDFLRDNSSAGPGTAQRNRVNGSRDPFFGNDRNPKTSEFSTLTPPPQDAPAVPIPIHNTEWDIASKDNTTAHRGGPDAVTATSAKSRTHIVTDGETLSSIAGKYLGSQARYQEVFQANRDQLKSANDLKIGMKLNIPDRAETRSTSGSLGSVKSSSRISPDQTVKTLRPTTKPSGNVTDQSNEAAESTDSTNRKPKFKPAKSGPSIRRTTDADEVESLGKTLSQVPPQDLPEIDDGLLAELERDLETQVTEKSATAAVSKVAQADQKPDVDSADSKNE